MNRNTLLRRWLGHSCLVATCAMFSVACDPAENATSLDDDSFIGPGNPAAGKNSYSLIGFQDCDGVEDELKSRLTARMEEDLERRRAQLIEYGYDYGYGWDGPVSGGDAEEPTADFGDDLAEEDGGNGSFTPRDDTDGESGDPVEGEDYSGTNNQEEGVDEADFVKTDGSFIYSVQNHALTIFAVPEFGEIEVRGHLNIDAVPQEVLLGEDAIVLFSYVYPYELDEEDPIYAQVHLGEGRFRYNSYTRIDVISLDEERMNPTVSKSILLEGNYFTARRIGNKVRMVSHANINLPGLQTYISLGDLSHLSEADRTRTVNIVIDALIEANRETIDGLELSDLAPFAADITNGGLSELQYNNANCSNFAAVVDGTTNAVTSILSLNLLEGSTSVEADHILANWPTVYASSDVLLLAESTQPQWWYDEEAPEDGTNIHRFDISGNSTVYTGSGQVPGQIIGQFALSEYEGDIRVATTRNQWGTWWQDEWQEMTNWLYVLNGEDELVERGSVGPLAEGERIWSARFRGDEAFLVTFRQTDPLWTIDISDPDNPRTVGELHIPGVSTYIHPIDDDTLLTIGIPGDDSGWLDWGRDRVSLFDISDRANPAQTDILDLGSENGWGGGSEARYEHKAFQYFDGVLAVPQTRYEQVYAGCNDRYYEGEPECWEECWEAEDGTSGCEVYCEDGTRPSDNTAPEPEDIAEFYEQCDEICLEELDDESCDALCSNFRGCFDDVCEGSSDVDCAEDCLWEAMLDSGIAVEGDDGGSAEGDDGEDLPGSDGSEDSSSGSASDTDFAPEPMPAEDCFDECMASCEEMDPVPPPQEDDMGDAEGDTDDDVEDGANRVASCETVCEIECTEEEETEETCRYPYYTTIYTAGLALVDVDAGVGLSSRGLITQDEETEMQEYDCYGYGQQGIRRSIFMGDYIYAVSHNAITVHNLETLEKVDSARITRGESSYSNGCYYDDVAEGGVGGGVDVGAPDRADEPSVEPDEADSGSSEGGSTDPSEPESDED